MAIGAAAMAKHFLPETSVSLVTDESSMSKIPSAKMAQIEELFEHIILKEIDWNSDKENIKVYKDTGYHQEKAEWHNTTRKSVYDLTPYDETVMIDTDYLIQSKCMDLVWGSEEDFRINKDINYLNNTKTHDDQFLNPFSIPLYWATVVYFRKTERTRLLFDLIAHIQENYQYYKYMYKFKGDLYRNDFSFSIAIHMLAGFLENKEFNSLPFQYLASPDRDDLIQVKENELKLLVGIPSESWSFTLINVNGTDIHIMNKFSIGRHLDKILELYL